MSQASPELGETRMWPASRRTTVIAVLTLALLAASYVMNAADRNVFPVLLKFINHDYGFSLAAGGLLSTIFTLGIGLGGFPAGRMMDRLSRKTVMLIGIVIYSAFTLLTPLAFGFGDMAAYRTFSGVGEALQNAALFSAVGAYFYRRRSLALGVLNVSYGLGGAIGPWVGAQVFAATGSWGAPFYIYGLVGFLLAVLILLFVSKSFTESAGATRDVKVAEATVDNLPGTLLNRTSVFLCLACGAAGLSLYSYLGLYPTFLQDQLGFSVVDAGGAAFLFGIGSLVASVPAGYLGDRFGNKVLIQISFLAALIVGALMFMVATEVWQQNVLSFLEGAFGSGFVYVNLYSALQRSITSARVGRASGAFVTFFFLPSTVSGYLFALLVGSIGWAGAAGVQLMALLVLGIIFTLFVKMPRPEAASGKPLHTNSATD